MHLELALDPGDGGPHLDVVVEAPTGTRLRAVHDQLTTLLPAAARLGPTAWAVGGASVSGDAVLGLPPLLRAAVLRRAVTTGTDVRPGDRGGARSARRAPVEVSVAWGPVAGATHPLQLGEHVIGRGSAAGVVLDDPEVSRVHAALEVSARGVRVRDLGSANGTRLRGPRSGAGGGTAVGTSEVDVGEVDVGGVDVDGAWHEVPPGTDVLVGGSALRLRTSTAGAAGAGAAVTAAGDGHLHVSRSPRSRVVRPVLDLEVPEEPRAPEPARISVLAVVLPIGLSVVMAVVWSPMALLFGLAAPVITLGSAWGDRRAQRAQHARALEVHRRRCAHLRAAAAAGVAEDRAALSALGPDAGEVVTAATTLGARLWERGRGDDQLLLRLGRGPVPSTVRLRHAGDSTATADPVATTHQGAPVLLALPEVGVLGISGPHTARRGLATSLLVQAAVLHSPRDVRVVVLRGGGAAPPRCWEWVGLLPHHAVVGASDVSTGPGSALPDGAAESAAELLEEVRRRELAAERGGGSRPADGSDPGAGEPAVVVVLDGAGHLRRVPGVAAVLERGPAVGVLAVCLEEDAAALPVECRAVAETTGPHGGLVHLRSTPGAAGAGGREGRWDGPVPGRPGGVEQAAAGTGIAADLVPAAVARTVARALAPLRDATPGHGGGVLPARVSLLEVLDVDATDAGAVAAAWSLRPRSTRVALGRRATGTWSVDLERDGPHVLVAGTTGSGKSELLVALVTSLAVGNRPEELAVVLVDYKGGAAFADLVDLPHVVGLVTDLDAHLTQRALVSLQAEVRRRERVLRDAGCRDHAEHVRRRAASRATGRSGEPGPVLPRLVVVVDEFLVLAEELPDFLGGLVRLAAVGRSLGVHLVLATQRPAGVVSADIRANTALRIALRVQDDGDSTDVVDSRDAARIDARLPGRAVVRSGSGPLVEVQAARASGTRPAAGPETPTARRRGAGAPGVGPAAEAAAPLATDPVSTPPPGAEPPSDVRLVVAALRRAAEGAPRPRSPWLPPLPDVVRLRTADPSGGGASADEGEQGAGGAGAGDGADDPIGPGSTGAPVLALGIADLPGQQRRAPLRWDVGTGPLLIVGAPRSGRTTAVRAVLAAAADHSPSALHVHVLAPPSPVLAGLEELAQVGAVVDPGDHERVLRLLHLLTSLVRRRQRTRAAGTAAGPAGEGPATLLLVDGADRVLAAAGAVLTNPADDVGELLHELLVTGPAVGVVPLLTGDRSLLLGRCGALVRHRLLLALADPADAVLAGVPAREVPARMPPGRVLVLGDAAAGTGGGDGHGDGADGGDHGAPSAVTQAQIGVLGACTGGGMRREVAALVARSADRWSGDAARPPAVPALPERLTTAELRLTAAGSGALEPVTALPVGVGGDDLGVVALDVDAAPLWLVAGPAGSGRSAALVTLAEAARERRRPVVVLAGARSPLARWAAESAVPCPPAQDASAVAAALAELVTGGPDARSGHGRAGPAPVVLVDDVERLVGTASEDVLAGHVDAVVRQATPALVVVAAGTPAELTGAYRGLVPLLRRARTGLLLHPLGAGDGELLGVHLPRGRPGPPGRATIVVEGRASSLQVALSTEPVPRLPAQSRRGHSPGDERSAGPAAREPLAGPSGGVG